MKILSVYNRHFQPKINLSSINGHHIFTLHHLLSLRFLCIASLFFFSSFVTSLLPSPASSVRATCRSPSPVPSDSPSLSLCRLGCLDSQIPIRNFSGISISQNPNCSKGRASNNRARYNFNSIQSHKHPFFQRCLSFVDTKDTNTHNSKTRKDNQIEVKKRRKFKENKTARALFTDMWWVDLKAALGQRINLEGILCSTMVILKDPKLALPHIAVPDIRYIDWAELRRKGFKGVVFDKDNTITAPYSLTPWPPLESSLERCKLEFGPDIAVFSNSAGLHEYDHDGSKARRLEGAIGIKVIRHKVKKPAGTAEEIEKHFGCESSRLIMVGDRPFTDVVYGNRNGFLTILTEPLSLAEEPFIVKQVRKLESSFVSYWKRRGLKPNVQKLLPDPRPCVKEPLP